MLCKHLSGFLLHCSGECSLSCNKSLLQAVKTIPNLVAQQMAVSLFAVELLVVDP